MSDTDSRPRSYPISIRGLNPELYRKVRIFALERGVPVGEALNILLLEYFEIKAHEPGKVTWREPRG